MAGCYDLFVEGTLFVLPALVCLQFEIVVPRAAWLLAFLLWDVVYHLVFELVAEGQTPGKNVVGIQVVSMDGERARAWQIMTRNVARLIDFLPFAYFAAGIRMLVTIPALRWGDELAHTVVAECETYSHKLFRVHAGTAAFNTAPDAYLLEGYVLRAKDFDPQFAEVLGKKLAQHFMQRYDLQDEPELAQLYARGMYADFLQLLYFRERASAQDSFQADEKSS